MKSPLCISLVLLTLVGCGPRGSGGASGGTATSASSSSSSASSASSAFPVSSSAASSHADTSGNVATSSAVASGTSAIPSTMRDSSGSGPTASTQGSSSNAPISSSLMTGSSSTGNVPRVLENALVRYGFSAQGNLITVQVGARTFNNTMPALWRVLLVSTTGVTTAVDPTGVPTVVTAPGALTLQWQDQQVAPGQTVNVVVTASLGATEPRALWTIRVENNSNTVLAEVDFPRFASAMGPTAGDEAFLVPCFGGALVSAASAQNSDLDRFVYPGNLTTQVTALLDLGTQQALYLAALDPRGAIKAFGYQPHESAAGIWVRMVPEALDQPGNDLPTSYPVEFGPLAGDWFDVAQTYRRWALNQAWTPPPLHQQAGLPTWVLANRFLSAPVNLGADFDPRVTDLVLGYQAALGLTADGEVAMSPFLWNAGPYTEGDYFPVRPGFSTEVMRLNLAGVPVLPYTNPRVVPMDLPSWDGTLEPAATKATNGSIHQETYYGSPMAVMCPAAAATQQRHQDVTTRLLTAAAVRGMHLDQLGSANALFCFDPTHGHAAGAGAFWTDGLRALASGVRAAGRAQDARFATTTEDPLEVLNDVVEFHTNHYMLGAVVRLELAGSVPVPLLTAIYHDRTSYMLSATAIPSNLSQASYDAFQAYGYLIGNHLSAIDSDVSRGPFGAAPTVELSYLRTLMDSYAFAAPYLLHGEMKRIPDLSGTDLVTVDYPHPYGDAVTLQATITRVGASLWSAADGSIGLILANPTPSGQAVDVRLGKDAHQLGPGTLQATRVFPGAPELLGAFPGDVQLTLDVGAHAAVVIVLAP